MKKPYIQTLVWVLILSITMPAGSFAQSTSIPPIFRQEELDQMLAPIALYPDPLLVQMMMAATYPLEVVEAARWVNANPNLKGDQLAIALEKKDWDPSVKSLVNFPTALAMMDGNLTWTQNLGDAFLAQKDQVMDTLQQLRARAQAQGNLRTTAEQRVTTRDQVIVVEPADPQVIYVPAYNPSVVFGPWWYPEYPPYYYNPLGYVIGGIINFGVGLLIGVPWGYAWGGFDWYHRDVYCNVYQNHYNNNYINRDRYTRGGTPGEGGHGQWRHDPSHRRNVAYRDRRTQENHEQATRRRIPDTGKGLRQNRVNAKSAEMRFVGRPGTDQQAVSGSPGRTVPDRRTPTQVQDRTFFDKKTSTAAQDRGAFDGKTLTSVPGRAAPDRRIPAQMQDRTALDMRSPTPEKYRADIGQRKTAPVIERPGVQQRRETSRLVASPNRPPTVFGGIAGQSYRGSGMTNQSYSSGSGIVNPSFRNKAALQPSYSPKTSVQSSQRATGFTGRSGGSFPSKSGGISGKTQGTISGVGGNHRQKAG